MPATGKLTRTHLLRGLLCLSVISCFAWPTGFNRPRELAAPLLAPLSHGGTYVSATVKRNLNDLLAGGADEQTVRDVLAANEPLRRQVVGHVNETLQRRLISYERRLAEYEEMLAQMSQTRQALEGFPCMLLPASVIGSDSTAYGRSRLLRHRGRAAAGQYVTTRELLTGRPTGVPLEVAVLSGEAVVGRIISSGAWTARLQLVSDRDFRMRAYVVRLVYEDRDRKIRIVEADAAGGRRLVERTLTVYDPLVPVYLTGDGAGLSSADVPADHAIEPGDQVVTMGEDAWLPMQVVVGRVRSVEPVEANSKHVRLEIEPAADLASLRRVCVVAPLATREDQP